MELNLVNQIVLGEPVLSPILLLINVQPIPNVVAVIPVLPNLVPNPVLIKNVLAQAVVQ